MRLILINLLSIILVTTCVPVTQDSGYQSVNRTVVYDNLTYVPHIRTAMLTPGASYKTPRQPSVVQLGKTSNLLLEFDAVEKEFVQYNVKIIHCNYDWKPSNLQEIQYLNSYNEFQISDYQFSFNALTEYIHYTFRLPQVKMSGNYLLVVFRENNENDIMLTRRFMVYEPKASINYEVSTPMGSRQRRDDHQINFDVAYGGVEVMNPMNEIKILLRQNYRWDNAITDIQPTMVREDQGLLMYESFSDKNIFTASNEFRFFDISSLQYLGPSVGEIEKGTQRFKALLDFDGNRSGMGFSVLNDINGQYYIYNRDMDDGEISGDYVDVYFFLKVDKIPQDVYVIGDAFDWKLNNETRMEYNEEYESYILKKTLKQGYYNYMYLIPEATNPYKLEGNYTETENIYEIFAYFRGGADIADRLIGYTRFVHNER